MIIGLIKGFLGNYHVNSDLGNKLVFSGFVIVNRGKGEGSNHLENGIHIVGVSYTWEISSVTNSLIYLSLLFRFVIILLSFIL